MSNELTGNLSKRSRAIHVRMPLLPAGQLHSTFPQELLPVGIVEIEANGKQSVVKLELAGMIMSESVPLLRQFLQDVSTFRAANWILHMENLTAISKRGLRVLLQFSRVLRKRGFGLRVDSIHLGVLTAIRELDLMHAFVWPNYTCEHRNTPALREGSRASAAMPGFPGMKQIKQRWQTHVH